jgi:LmbE family N-acetylglucosaminyl deacetylase
MTPHPARNRRPPATQLDVKDLGTVLGVWAHPDDEAYLSAGLMATARDGGQRVVVATATAGEAAAIDGGAELRRRELDVSLAAVDVHEHHWLGFVDGECADVAVDAGTASVRRVLEQVRPDTILSFGPDGMTGHADHMAVSGWVRRAWTEDGQRAILLQASLTQTFHRCWGRLSARHGIWMPGAEPPAVPDSAVAVRVRATGSLSDRKLAALRAHASQTDALRAAVGDDTYRRWWAEEAFVRVAASQAA